MRLTINLLFFILCSSSYVWAQEEASTEIPKVFVIGEDDAAYDKLSEEYTETLLSVSNNEMEKALESWLYFIQAVEDYGRKINFDINGVKLWLHVFWDKSGNMQHIAYHLQPDSRNINTKELSAFFKSFLTKYQMPITSEQKFAHSTKAMFPTFYDRIPTEE